MIEFIENHIAIFLTITFAMVAIQGILIAIFFPELLKLIKSTNCLSIENSKCIAMIIQSMKHHHTQIKGKDDDK